MPDLPRGTVTFLFTVEDERAFAPLGGWQRHRDTGEARIRQLADEEFERGLAAGRELELDQAVEEPLAAP